MSIFALAGIIQNKTNYICIDRGFSQLFKKKKKKKKIHLLRSCCFWSGNKNIVLFGVEIKMLA